MKKIILATVSATALLLAGSAFAAGNASTIDQIGDANVASVDQTGSPHDAVSQITQGVTTADANNHASVTQGGGPGNSATITQSQGGYGVANPSNTSNSDQEGSNGSIVVVQVGNSTSTIEQLAGSSNETALVGQSQNNDTSTISQGGAKEFALVNQEEGNGNSALIIQSGIGDGPVAPLPTDTNVPGPGDLQWSENLPGDSVLPGAALGLTTYGPTGAIIDQVGSNNVGAITQGGNQNFADVSQENDAGLGGNYGAVFQTGVHQSDAVMYQYGQGNTAIINQSGTGETYSTIWQNGNSNQGYSTQVGAEHSVIQQGVTDDGDFGSPAVINDFASVDQQGGDDTSTVTQLGDSDTAWVSQMSGHATSTVTQTGSSNLATVHQ